MDKNIWDIKIYIIQNELKKIKVNANLDKAVSKMKRIGVYKEVKKRPTRIKLLCRDKNLEILRNVNQLKVTDIWISEDFP